MRLRTRVVPLRWVDPKPRALSQLAELQAKAVLALRRDLKFLLAVSAVPSDVQRTADRGRFSRRNLDPARFAAPGIIERNMSGQHHRNLMPIPDNSPK